MIKYINNKLFKNKPLISVIIPNYNNAKYLSECLDSVLSQTYKNMEIVVCDDCSTDGSQYILEELDNKYKKINVLYNNDNCGVSYTRHHAIVESKGEYISTLDSDDLYTDKRKLELEMKLIQKYNKYNESIIAYSNVSIIDEKGNRLGNYQNAKIKEGDLLFDILSRSCMIPRDFIFTKDSYFKVGGFDLDRNLHEDWDLKIRLASLHKFFYTGIEGIAYRKHTNSLSDKTERDMLKSLMEVFEKNIDCISPDLQEMCKKEFYQMIEIRENRLPK